MKNDNIKAKNKKYFRFWMDIFWNNIVLVIGILISIFLLLFFIKVLPRIDSKSESLSSQNFVIRNLFIWTIVPTISLILNFIFHKRKFIFWKKVKRKNFLWFHKHAENTSSRFLYNIYMKFISIFFKNEISSSKADSRDALIEKLKNDQTVIVIYGNSFAGKTTFIDEVLYNFILKDQEASFFAQIDNRIKYIDFSKNENPKYNKFISNYNSGKYQKDIVIFDNLNYLSPSDISNLLYRIFENKNVLAKCILFITEDLSFFNNLNVSYEIFNMSNKKIQNKGSYNYDDEKIITMCNSDEDIEMYFQIIRIKNEKFTNKKIMTQFQNIFSNFDDYLLYKFIVINSAFSIENNLNVFWKKYLLNMGVFSKRKLRKINQLLKKVTFSKSSHIELYRFNKYIALKILICMLKEDETCKYLKRFDLSDAKCKVSFNWIISIIDSIQKDEGFKKKYFDEIIKKYSFKFVGNMLELILQLYPSLYDYNFLLAIVNDRMDKLEKARDTFKLFFEHPKYGDLAMIYYLQSNHGFEDDLENLNKIKSKDDFFTFSKRYWELHIAMHHGIFNYEKFVLLLNDIERKIDKLNREQSPYDVYHLIRRSYFDTLRVYYLAYINDINEFIKLNQYNKIIQYLRDENEKEFIIYYNKFNISRFIHFDILSNYINNDVIDSSYIDALKNNIKILKNSSENYFDNLNVENNLESLIKICCTQYKEAYQYAKQIGDRTVDYIEHNKIEIELWDDLYNYQRNSIDEYFENKIQPYKNYLIRCEKEKKYEYCAYACCYLIKAYFQARIFNKDTNNYNTFIQDYLNKAKNYIYQSPFENTYALIRLDIYTFLFNLLNKNIKNANINDEISKLESKCKVVNNFGETTYKRELYIISLLKNQVNLSSGLIHYLLRFYPIVTQ